MLIPLLGLFSRNRVRAKGVLHLGANKGQEAEAYRLAGVPKVVWVEALPDVFAQLQANVASYPGSHAICACVSDTDGQKVSFNVANNEGQSSSLLEFGTHAIEHPDVKFTSKIEMETVRVDTLLKKNSIELEPGWFLNMDLQGAEMLALKGMDELMRFFDWVYIEVNAAYLYKGCPLVSEIDAFMLARGLYGKEVKMMKQGWGDKFYVRKP